MRRLLLLSLALLADSTVCAAELREQITIEDTFISGFAPVSHAAVFSPNGKLMVTASSGGGNTIFWDSATGKKLATLADGDNINDLAFSPDGRILAGGPSLHDWSIRLWDVQTRKMIGRLKGGEVFACWMVFTPDGSTLATGTVGESDVLIWGVKAEKVVATLKAKAKGVWGLAFSSDGKSLAVGYDDGTIRVWDMKTEKVTATLTEHTDAVQALGFELGDRTLLSAGFDKTIRRWDLTTGKATSTTKLKEAVKPYRFVFNASLTTLATAEDKGELMVWDTKTGALLGSTKTKDRPQVLILSPDGKRLATDTGGGLNGPPPSVRIWAVPEAVGK